MQFILFGSRIRRHAESNMASNPAVLWVLVLVCVASSLGPVPAIGAESLDAALDAAEAALDSGEREEALAGLRTAVGCKADRGSSALSDGDVRAAVVIAKAAGANHNQMLAKRVLRSVLDCPLQGNLAEVVKTAMFIGQESEARESRVQKWLEAYLRLKGQCFGAPQR